MLVTFEGEEFQFDIEGMDLSEARYIFRQTGLTIKGLLDGLTNLNPEAMVALYWLMLKQNGKVQDISKLNFKVIAFAEAVAEASEREEAQELGITVEALRARKEAEAEADPTEAAIAAAST